MLSEGTVTTDSPSVHPPLYTVTLDVKSVFTFSSNVYANNKIKRFKYMTTFKHFRMTLTNQICIHEEIKSRLRAD